MLPVVLFRLPTFYPVGPVNVYLIKIRPYTLIDAGPPNDEAFKTLKANLAAEGVELSEINRIILTHGHSDHSGMADKLQQITGAQVWIHEKELTRVQEGYWQLDEALLTQIGLPKIEIAKILDETAKRNATFGSKLLHAQCLDCRETFSCPEYNMKVIFTPGHSSGSVCLYEPQTKTLFSGDHFLERITPNPLLEADGNGYWVPASCQYLNSLQKVLNHPVSQVYPGHGDAFTDVENKATEVYANYRSKLNELGPLVNEKWQTPYNFAQRLYPRAKGFELFLAVSKVIGLLDLMREAGQIILSERAGLIRFRRAW